MAQLRESRLSITGTPFTSGLDLSASRDMVDETQLWEMEGAFNSENKTLIRRPSFVQWGTQIIEPTAAVANNGEHISKALIINSTYWDEVETVGNSTSMIFDNGTLVLSGWQAASGETGSSTTRRGYVGNETFNDDVGFDGSIFLSFVLQAKFLETAEFATIKFAVKADQQKEIAITSAGIALKTGVGTYLSLSGTDIAIDGLPHRIDISSAGGIAYRVSIDGVLIDEGLWAYVADTADFFVEVTAKSDDTLELTPYSILLSSFILRDSYYISEDSKPYYSPAITDLQTVREPKAASANDTFSLLAAGKKYLWIDYALRGVWTPIAPLSREKTRFSKFRGSTIICNYADNSRKTEVYKYDGGVIEKLDQAPDIRFTTEYANRLWGAGDVNHKLRAYYSGDRQPNLWWNPDDPNIKATEDAEDDAGFIEFPGDDKTRVRFLSGDFFGMLMVSTDVVWLVTGMSPRDFERRRLTAAISADGAQCGVDVYNDYWLLSKDGISSAQTTDKYGDIQGQRVSTLARELFDTGHASGRMLTPEKLYDSKMVYFPKWNTVLFHSEEAGEESPGVIYALNIESNKWSGPWREECASMRVVTLTRPTQDMVAIGTYDGRVKFMTSHVSNTDTIKISSPIITGRSIDPKLDSMKKSWKNFRLKIVPTGNWDVTFRWKAEDRDWETITKKLCLPDHPLIGDTYTVDQSHIKSDLQPMVLEFPIDKRSLSIKYEILTNAPWIKFSRWELDFHVDGHEKD